MHEQYNHNYYTKISHSTPAMVYSMAALHTPTSTYIPITSDHPKAKSMMAI